MSSSSLECNYQNIKHFGEAIASCVFCLFYGWEKNEHGFNTRNTVLTLVVESFCGGEAAVLCHTFREVLIFTLKRQAGSPLFVPHSFLAQASVFVCIKFSALAL